MKNCSLTLIIISLNQKNPVKQIFFLSDELNMSNFTDKSIDCSLNIKKMYDYLLKDQYLYTKGKFLSIENLFILRNFLKCTKIFFFSIKIKIILRKQLLNSNTLFLQFK